MSGQRYLLILFAVVAVGAGASFFYPRVAFGQGNSDPVMTELVPSDAPGSGSLDGFGFTPVEGATKTLYVRGSIADADGCADIASVDVVIYRKGMTSSCSEDENDCYKVSTANFTGCGQSELKAYFEVSVEMANYADPTDAGAPQEADSWSAYAVASDASKAKSAPLEHDFEVNSLLAIGLDQVALNYGTVSLGAESAEASLVFSNKGNRAADAYVKADQDMTSALPGYADIPSTSVKFSTDTGIPYANRTSVQNGTDQAVGMSIPQQTTAAVPTRQAFFVFKAPAQIVKGTYANTLTFTAYGP